MTETITMEEPTYDIWITVKKALIQATIVALVAFLTYLTDVGFPQIILEYPEYAVIITIITSVIVAFLNWYKHRDDTVTVVKDKKTGKILEVCKNNEE